jgi:RNA polymerase sigma-70 factor (ECF subfamily)
VPASPPPADAVTAWARAAGQGDRAAAAAFIEATQHDLYRFLIHLADRGEVADLCQETYLRAMKALPSFAARASAKTWLFAIARRAAADHVRAAMRRPRLVAAADWRELADRSGPAGHARLDDAVVLRELLSQLAPDRREAFVATQVLGFSYAEAAEVCDCPIGTIRSRVARARADLIALWDAAERRPGPRRVNGCS